MIINKFFLLSKYFNAAISFVIILIISKILNLADFGEFAFYKLILQYLLYSEFGFLQYLFRQYSTKENTNASLLNQIFTYLLISFFSIATIFYISGEYFINFFTNHIFYLYAIIAAFLSIISKFTVDQLRINDKINILIILETISNISLLVGVSILYYFSITTLNYYLIIFSLYMSPFLIYTLYNKHLNIFIKNFKFNFVFNKEIFVESGMLFFYGIASLIFISIDRFIIKFYFGLEALGLYSFAFTLVMGFYAIIQNIFWLNTPNIIYLIKTENTKELKITLNLYKNKMVKFYVGIFLISLFIYEFLIDTYYAKFENTIYLFILIHVYNFISILYVFDNHYLITKKMYKDLNYILLITIVVNIVLNIFTVLLFHNIYLLIIGSICSHILYMILLNKKIKQCYI